MDKTQLFASHLYTQHKALIGCPSQEGERTEAVSIQALPVFGAFLDTPDAVQLWVDGTPDEGERSVLEVTLTVEEAKHLLEILTRALRGEI